MDHSIIPSSSSSSSKRPREEDYAPAASSDLNAIDNDTSSPSATAVNNLGPLASPTDNSHDLPPKPKKSFRSSRAAKACAICRRQKTRCFPFPKSASCLRCVTLGFECSFLTEGNGPSQHQTEVARANTPFTAPKQLEGKLETRLNSLEANLGEVLRLIQNQGTGSSSLDGSSADHLFLNQDYMFLNGSAPQFGYKSTSFITSPFSAMGSLMKKTNYPPPIERLLWPQMVSITENIITMGYITREKAIELLQMFLLYYNQWVSLPSDVPTEKLLDLMIERSSLLLTVCCCVVIRYHDPVLKEAMWPFLLQKLKYDFQETMHIVPHIIEFIQALTVMSIYASSLSNKEFIIDAWFISSVALQHFVSRNILGLVRSFDGQSPVTQMDEITAYRVWNHLCLVHLVNCVMSGRMCILDHIRINQCRKTLEIVASTNFDGRMVAEINFQLIIYTFIEANQPLSDVEEKLRIWHDEWGYLFEQPTTQFVETGYHYGYFLVLYHSNYRQLCGSPDYTEAHILKNDSSDVARVFEICDVRQLRRMIRHALKVIEGLLVVRDLKYFTALSDQIHFCGVYAAIMLARLIETVKSQKRILDISNSLFIKSMGHIDALSSQFKEMSQSSDDVAAKYANAIEEALLSCKLVPSAI